MSSAPKADNLPFPPKPEQKFGLLAMDMPWHHETRADLKNPLQIRTPQKHYPTATIDHLMTMPVREMALPNAWVMAWMTGPLIVRGVHIRLFDAWGVEPSSMGFVWLKLWNNFDPAQLLRTPLLENDLALGMGLTTRQNAEYVVFGRIGRPKVGRHDIRQVIISPRREHSRKPEEFYRRAENFCLGPRLDMFGGKERPGWTPWTWGHRPGESAPYPIDGYAHDEGDLIV